MPYEPPAFQEIKMDAEIGSYQDDFEFDRDQDPVVPRTRRTEGGEPQASPDATRSA